MSHVIAVVSASGGAGRSTVSYYLAYSLAKQFGEKALLIDLGAASMTNAMAQTCGMTEYLAGQASISEGLQNIEENFDCLPLGKLDPIEFPIFAKCLNSEKLASALEALNQDYQWIFFDTPAGFGALTQAILNCCNFVIPLVQARPSALTNFWTLLRLIQNWQQANQQLRQLLGVLPTRVNPQCSVSRAAMSDIWSGMTGLFEVMIPETPAFEQALISEENGLIPSNSREMQRFQFLALEVQSRIQSIMKEVSYESSQLVSAPAYAPQVV